MRRYHGHHSRRRHGRPSGKAPLIRLAAVLIVLLVALITLDTKMRPIVLNIAQTQAKNTATQLVNDAINDVIDGEKITYQSLVTIDKADDNTVTSVQADAMRMNRLKASIGNHIAQKFNEVKNNKLRVPIGSFLGSEILSGRGPDVSIYISLTGSVVTNINSTFSSAGINQTLHSIMLGVQIELYVLMPGYRTTAKLNTEVCMAQTVIVGITPEAYANIVAPFDNANSKNK